MRVGFGYDIHQLAANKKLVLGGIEIKHPKGLVAYTDGDVVIHAIIDALLGASGLGDIGQHFPDTDPKWKNASSIDLLEVVYVSLKNKGYKVVNIDCTVVAEEPNITPYKDSMKRLLARVLEIKNTQINIKGKKNEGQDSVGQKNSICAFAVALVE